MRNGSSRAGAHDGGSLAGLRDTSENVFYRRHRPLARQHATAGNQFLKSACLENCWPPDTDQLSGKVE